MTRRQRSSPQKKRRDALRAALAGRRRLTAWRKTVALRVKREGGSDAAACAAAGIRPWSLRYWKRSDDRFASAYEEAVETGTEVVVDLLLAEGIRRALASSDKLLVHLLSSLRPEVYSIHGQAVRVGATPFGFSVEQVAVAMRRAAQDVMDATEIAPPGGDGDVH